MTHKKIAYIISAIVLGSHSPLALASSRSVSYTYNDIGQVLSVDGPRTDVEDVTAFAYGRQGNRVLITNALGHTTQIPEHDGSGRPLTVIAPNGLVTTLEYDLRGRLWRIDKGGEVTELTYDPAGNITAIKRPGNTLLYMHYDAAYRLVAIKDIEGNRIDYTLDAMGNRTKVTVNNAGGQLVKAQQATFDSLSRTISDIGAVEQTTKYTYDDNGNLLTITDARDKTTEYSYDALNRLVSTTDPLDGLVEYGYDPQDNLISVTDANRNSTTYVYDGLGNLIEQNSPDTGTTIFTHDEAGNIKTRTDAKLQTTVYHYDALNRLTSTEYADGSQVLYGYDNCLNGIGRLCRLTKPSGTTAWSYDIHGRQTQRVQQIFLDGGTTELVTDFHYNSAGQLVRITYPSGLQVGYEYQQGKVSRISLNGSELLAGVSYQPFGPVSSWRWSNGQQSLRGYDLDGRLIRQTLGGAERTLGYDMVGNITAITDPANSQAFDYDSLNRLIAANDATFNLAWHYDANGNRLSESSNGTTTAFNLDVASNRLLAVDDNAYIYDANGNLINDGEHSYQYSAQDRLIAVDDGATGEYRYNALGQRIYKRGVAAPYDVNGDGIIDKADLQRVNGKDGTAIAVEGPGKGQAKGKGQSVAGIATQIGASANNGQGKGVENRAQAGSRQILFAYDKHRLLGEYDTQGNALQETVWLGNLPVATVKNGVVYFIHTDHLGTPRMITDIDNTEVWRWDSDPFGTTAANEDPDGDGRRFSYNLRFPGQYFDAETGRHYNYFRDYDPATGRYIESDPIGLAGGLNLYAYVESNPLLFVGFVT